MTYALRFDTKEQAQQLIESLGIEWNEPHMTHTTEDGRIDVTVLGDLPQQDADGNVVMEGEGEDAKPVMTGKYHLDILSDYDLELTNTITPSHPMHRFAGHL